MKLHVSACNGHRQVSTTIKKSVYICVRACWCRDLYASIPCLLEYVVQIAIYDQYSLESTFYWLHIAISTRY